MEQNTNRGPDGAITEPINVIRVTKMTDQELATRLERLKKVSDPDEKLEKQIKDIQDEQKYRLDMIESLAAKLKAEPQLRRSHFSSKLDGIWEKAKTEGNAIFLTEDREEPLKFDKRNKEEERGWIIITDSEGRFISVNPDSIEGKALRKVLS